MTEEAAPDLSGRVILVTGASRGFGAAAAKAIGAAGAHAVLTARTVGGLEETDDAIRTAGGERATLIPLDLRDGGQIDKLGPALLERFGRLDGLVAAAGTLQALTPIAHMQTAHWTATFKVNLDANFRLIRILDPLLRRSAAGRAVVVTDRVGAPGLAYWNDYAASKAALETLVLSWAAELTRTALRVNLFDPGPMRTALRAVAFPGDDPANPPPPAARVPALLPLLGAACTAHGTIVAG